MSRETLAFGRTAEADAARYLARRGYRIVDRNVRLWRGEIDLVAFDGDVLVFVEVKARRGTGFGGASAAVDGRKQGRLTRLAELYRARRGFSYCLCRFDLVLIEPSEAGRPTCRLIQNAFEAREG